MSHYSHSIWSILVQAPLSSAIAAQGLECLESSMSFQTHKSEHDAKRIQKEWKYMCQNELSEDKSRNETAKKQACNLPTKLLALPFTSQDCLPGVFGVGPLCSCASPSMCWICSDNDYTHIPKKNIVQFKKASLYVVVSCDATSIFEPKFTSSARVRISWSL